MRRKALLTISLIGCLGLVGCGSKNKSEFQLPSHEGQTTEYMNTTEYYEDNNLEDSDTSEPEGIKLVEISDEIKNAKITDEIYQVYDAVLKTDGSMTVREVFDAVQQATDFEVTIPIQDGAVVNGVDLTGYGITDANHNNVCYIVAYNDTTGTKDAFDQKVVEIRNGSGIHLYNCVMPSGIVNCYGFEEQKDEEEEQARQRRLEEMGGDVRWDSIEDFMKSHGVTHIQKISDTTWGYVYCPSAPAVVSDDGKEIYKEVSYTFGYAESTGNMWIDEVKVKYGTVDAIGFAILPTVHPYASELSDAERQEMIEEVINAVETDFVYGSAVDGLEFVQFGENIESDTMYMILKGSDGKYIAPVVNIRYPRGGGHDGNYQSWYGGNKFDSLEETMAYYEMTEAR